MRNGIRWLAGPPELCAQLSEALAADDGAVTLLREKPGRRRLCRVRLAGGADLFVKHAYGRRSGRARRARLSRALGLDAARREWRALRRLADAAVPVPTARALGLLADGGTLLVLDFIEGRALDAVLDDPKAARNPLLEQLADAVAALHAAGWVHRDLHAGNVLLSDDGPVLTDFQLALPLRGRASRLRDLGELDNSLWTRLSLAQRVRLRARALGLARPFASGEREALRAVAAASRARGRAHASSRMRRAQRPGRRFADLRVEDSRGLRRQSSDPQRIEAALARPERAAAGGLLVREFRRGPLGALADVMRGSPARRAWLAGIGLEAHGIACARAVAFVELPRRGLHVASRLVLEAPAADEPTDPERATAAAVQLLLRMHGRGVGSDGLGADGVRLEAGDRRSLARLMELERVRFPRRLDARSRQRALGQLRATLRPELDAAWRTPLARYRLLEPLPLTPS